VIIAGGKTLFKPKNKSRIINKNEDFTSVDSFDRCDK
jgi:hypothetical protein